MGNSQQRIYALPQPEPAKDGETRVYRNSVLNQGDTKSKPDHLQKATLQEMIKTTVKKNGDKNFLNSRNAEGKYLGKTYKEVLDIAEAVGSSIIHLKLTEATQEYKDYKLSMVGIFAKNREEWVTLDIANMLYNFCMIPLYDVFGIQAIEYCLDHSGMQVCFCGAKEAETLLKCQNFARLKRIVLIDDVSAETQ